MLVHTPFTRGRKTVKMTGHSVRYPGDRESSALRRVSQILECIKENELDVYYSRTWKSGEGV